MFSLHNDWKVKLKCESWTIDQNAREECPPKRYTSFTRGGGAYTMYLKNTPDEDIFMSYVIFYIIM